MILCQGSISIVIVMSTYSTHPKGFDNRSTWRVLLSLPIVFVRKGISNKVVLIMSGYFESNLVRSRVVLVDAFFGFVLATPDLCITPNKEYAGWKCRIIFPFL